jgi:hypothetical protein
MLSKICRNVALKLDLQSYSPPRTLSNPTVKGIGNSLKRKCLYLADADIGIDLSIFSCRNVLNPK